MSPTHPTIASEVERYLRTGETGPYHAAWPGDGFIDKARLARRDLEEALVKEVKRRAGSSRWCAACSHVLSRGRSWRRSSTQATNG